MPLTPENLLIRIEQPIDAAAVRLVNELAFARPHEAALVEALHAAGHVAVSLVAAIDDRIVGHILFSPVFLDRRDEPSGAVGLAPMAVVPSHQRSGIGSALVVAGLEACRLAGHSAVVVLGHPHYYPRFGFVPASSRGLRCQYDVPDDVFMVSELIPDAFDGRRGLVLYCAEFDLV